MALPHGAVGWAAMCDCGIPDQTHLLFAPMQLFAHIYFCVSKNSEGESLLYSRF